MADRNSERSSQAETSSTRAGTGRHIKWAAYVWGVLLLVSVFAAAPLALVSIASQLVVPPEKQVFALSHDVQAGAGRSVSGNAIRVTVTSIDEAQKTATMRLSGYRACASECPALTVQFFALDDEQRAGPASATLKVAEGARVVMESFSLPIRGIPSLYPFDHYALVVGTSRGREDGTAEAGQAASEAVITIESAVARFSMSEPEAWGPAVLAATDFHPAFQRVVELRFSRPLHLRVLTCLLVGLITAAAILSVTTEPLRRLVVGVGSVILGVWGVRSVLISDAPSMVTTVDLLLSGVILILLYGIVIRLFLVWRRDGWDGLLRVIQSG